jgi:hypothetical protein
MYVEQKFLRLLWGGQEDKADEWSRHLGSKRRVLRELVKD